MLDAEGTDIAHHYVWKKACAGKAIVRSCVMTPQENEGHCIWVVEEGVVGEVLTRAVPCGPKTTLHKGYEVLVPLVDMAVAVAVDILV